MASRHERRRVCTVRELDLRGPYAPADPARIRALAFAASLGPARAPRSAVGKPVDDLTIDLAGEEALLGYLARLAG